MMQTTANAPAVQRITFEEYLLYEGEIDVRYELFDGHLEAMLQPSAYHSAEQEYQRAEQAEQRADAESQRAEQEYQRAKKLADYLREQGIEPDRI
jgi:hypothetical protein